MREKLTLPLLYILLFLLLINNPIHAQWVKDGVQLCPSFVYQWTPMIINDGVGGAIITWFEWRTDNYNVYAQRIDKDGYILWPIDGVPISAAIDNQGEPQIIPDGTGGAIIAWRDYRSGNFDIYAQRIDSTGAVQWTIDGVDICTAYGGQYGPQAALDGSGGFFFTWGDDRGGRRKAYCQRVDSDGNALWVTNGIPLCTINAWQDRAEILSDGKGSAIIVWEDERYGGYSARVFGQRVNGDGNLLWPSDGVDISPCSGGYNLVPQLLKDDNAGAFIVWQQGMSGKHDIYAQRVDSTGTLQWPITGVEVCTAAGDHQAQKIVSDGVDGMIIAWFDTRSGRDDIYAQRVNGEGVCQWAADGVLVYEGPPAIGIAYAIPDIATDGTNGAIITWMASWGTESSWDIFAQRIDSSGTILWPPQAVAVCTADDWQHYPQIASNGAGGAIITWRDRRLGGEEDQVYAMRVTAEGQTVATLLQSFHASLEGSYVVVVWTLSEAGENMQFVILRAVMPDGEYAKISTPMIHQEGLSFMFTDKDCTPGTTYRYRVEVVDEEGRRLLFETDPVTIPRMPLALHQNYPNPFNPSTTITYYLPAKSYVTLDIYDIAGHRIIPLACDYRSPGLHSVEWDGKDIYGISVCSGTYLYRLRAGKETLSRKMILVR